MWKKTLDFPESFIACELKVGRYRLPNELINKVMRVFKVMVFS